MEHKRQEINEIYFYVLGLVREKDEKNNTNKKKFQQEKKQQKESTFILILNLEMELMKGDDD